MLFFICSDFGMTGADVRVGNYRYLLNQQTLITKLGRKKCLLEILEDIFMHFRYFLRRVKHVYEITYLIFKLFKLV